MIHEFCETCDGWVSYPASQEAHECGEEEATTQGEMDSRGQLVASADWSDDSDY